MELISREEAMQAVRDLNEIMLTNGEIINALCSVPAIENRLKGNWNKWNDTWECSICKFQYFPTYTFIERGANKADYKGNFCMNCGADMGGGE